MGRSGHETREMILAFIAEYIEENGYSPAIAEICEAVGLRSRSNVTVHLDILEAEGTIQRRYRATRSIRLTDETREDRGVV